MATGAVQIQLQTRNKSNASFEAVQYQQDMRHIAHYHNIKKSCLPIHVVQKITIICAPSGGVQQNLNIGAQLHIILYKKPPKHFYKLYGLIDFRCAQTLALPCAFGTTATS